ncbi:MAG: transposase [Pseudoxanthomonas sp.]
MVAHTPKWVIAGNSAVRSQSRQDDPHEGRITFRQWHYLASQLPGPVTRRSNEGLDTRRFVEAVLWVASTDSTWVDLPKIYGNFHAVYLRFTRWARLGMWEHVFDCLGRDPRLPALQARVREYQNIRNRRNKSQA